MSSVIVDETVEAVADVWRHEKGRALALIVSTVAAVSAAIARLIVGPSDIQAAAIGASIIVFGLAALASEKTLDRLRPVPPPPLHPVHRDDVIAKLEAIVLDRDSRAHERMDRIEARQQEMDDAARIRDQRITDFLVSLSSASGFVSSEAARLREASNS